MKEKYEREKEGTRALAETAEKSKKKTEQGHWQREGEKKGRRNTAKTKRVHFCT